MPRSSSDQKDTVLVAGRLVEDHGDQVVVEFPSLRGNVRQFVPKKSVKREGEGR